MKNLFYLYMKKYNNSNLLPLNINKYPWIFENNGKIIENKDTGKWMLYYPKSILNEYWVKSKKLYKLNKLEGIKSLKCSTNYKNLRSKSNEEGVIIFYCNNSNNKDLILNIGKKIIKLLDYTERSIIYYKTNEQTLYGTRATGNKKNHKYKLRNELYKSECLFTDSEEDNIIIRENQRKIKFEEYPTRFSKEAFEQLKKNLENEDYLNNYKKLKSGINPYTKRKIKLNGRTYNLIESEFKIKYKIPSLLNSGGYLFCVLFEDLKKYIPEEYINETERIYFRIDINNSIIKDYNILIDDINKKIKNLKTWDDYIIFNKKKYGLINKVKNYIHIENNCNGKMIKDREETEYIIRDRPFCYVPDGEYIISYYKCEKCNYECIHK
jgi:hypothetical protein